MSAKDEIAPSGEAWRVTKLESFPPRDRWNDWVEYDPHAWPRKVERRYRLVPTVCFNCEAACGLVAYVDQSTNRIRKLEGNPYHPGSRGRNCAKGPATLNQVEDPERLLYPMKRSGPPGSGRFERTTWDEVIATLAARIRKALVRGPRTEIMYPSAGRTRRRHGARAAGGGVDAHNSHTMYARIGAAGYACGPAATGRLRSRDAAKLYCCCPCTSKPATTQSARAAHRRAKMSGAKISTSTSGSPTPPR